MTYLLAAKRDEGIVDAGRSITAVAVDVSSTHPLATFEKQEVAERMRDRLSSTTQFDLVVVEVGQNPSFADVKSQLDEVPEKGYLSQSKRKNEGGTRKSLDEIHRSVDSYEALKRW